MTTIDGGRIRNRAQAVGIAVAALRGPGAYARGAQKLSGADRPAPDGAVCRG